MRSEAVAGGVYGLGASLFWGLVPAYWKLLGAVGADVIIAHRIAWSFGFVAILLTLGRRWGEVLAALRRRRTLGLLACTTALISGNWLLFIWAVNVGRVTEASLGYYISPLVAVLLARLFLGERLRPLQKAAVVLAAVGVAWLAIGLGTLPWVSLTLATSFGIYGLLRKKASVESLAGLTVETALATPFAIAWLLFLASKPAFGGSTIEALLLVGAGPITAVPLLWFATAARRLRYSTLGILQYVAPTCQLALAVLAYGEPFTERHAATFLLIWTAVVLYAADALRGRRDPVPAPAVARS